MIPLIPALVLAFLSFVASAFVILRIIIPILPPHPLSQRVSPAEFGLPRFRALSTADKGHIWLAALDLIALSIFIWQAVAEAKGAPLGFAAATDPASSIRIWIIMSVRQTCLLIITAVALLHIRLGRSVSFGKTHWLLWAPTMLVVLTSTTFAGTLSGAGISSLFIGLAAYSSTVAILTTVAFACLIRTLYNIKRNLAAIDEEVDQWPSVKQMEEKPRPSFGTEEIDAIKDGASWITSNASSRRGSISTWSFSTHHTATANSHHDHGRQRSQSSLYGKSSHSHEIIPPVPPLPSPYGTGSGDSLGDPDPFRRDIPTPVHDNHHYRQRLDSQTSWLTSTNGSHTTISAWSFPATPNEGSIRNLSTPDLHSPLTMVGSGPTTPALADAQVLGGYGYAPSSIQAEKGLKAIPASSSSVTEATTGRILGWLIVIWLPFGLGFPYLGFLLQQTSPNTIVSILLVLSVTLSSPILALNIIFQYQLPIPISLFESQDTLPTELVRGPSRMSTLPGYKYSYEYKRSMSTSPTVVDGRRSGDVWISKGDAVDGKNKFGRAVEMLNTLPKLSVLPPEEIEEIIPPVPIRGESPFLVRHNRSRSDTSVQFGRTRKESKTSSRLSGTDENLGFTAKVMVAQHHYSALAQTVVISNGLPEERENGQPNQLLSTTTGIALTKPSSHLRTRSISSVSGPETVSLGDSPMNVSGPPPSDPLPPTPPNVRVARLAQFKHKKSFSSGFSFGAVDNVNEIDALTAGVLPLLVPGLNIGDNMKIKNELPGTWSKFKSHNIVQKLGEFGEEFSSPEFHSTPSQRRPRNSRERKQSNRKKHLSLPSLGLGKEGVYSLATWSAEIKKAIEQYTAVPSNLDIRRRNTVFGADAVFNHMPVAYLHTVMEEHSDRPTAPLTRSMSKRSLGLRADVPHNIDEGCHSAMSLSTMLPPTSAASTITLFEDFEPGFGSSPQAESTPQNTVTQKPMSKHRPPPLPLDTKNNFTKSRSNIVYIKSGEDHDLFQDTTARTPSEQTTSNSSAISSFAQWSTRAVRPLIPKTSKLQRNGSGKAASAGKGLRPLSLLQDRNTNVIPENPDDVAYLNSPTASTSKLQEIRPLTLGKKQRLRPVVRPSAETRRDENSPPSLSSRTKGLKPLKLARSHTAKMRGILRKTEALPDVVIRPPSTAENTSSYVYNYHD